MKDMALSLTLKLTISTNHTCPLFKFKSRTPENWETFTWDFLKLSRTSNSRPTGDWRQTSSISLSISALFTPLKSLHKLNKENTNLTSNSFQQVKFQRSSPRTSSKFFVESWTWDSSRETTTHWTTRFSTSIFTPLMFAPNQTMKLTCSTSSKLSKV